jgi:hypothetical protein
MAFRSMINAFLPAFHIIPRVFMFFRSRRVPCSKGSAKEVLDNDPSSMRFFRCSKTTANTSDEDEWGLAFETGPAFTDSWGNDPWPNDKIQLAFTDKVRCRNSQEHGPGVHQ